MFVHQVVKNVRLQPGVSELTNSDGYTCPCLTWRYAHTPAALE